MKTKLLTCMLLFASLATAVQAKKVKGNGSVITKEIQISDYSTLELGGNISWNNDLFATKKDKQSPACLYTQNSEKATLTITTDENLISLFEINHSNGILSVRVQKNVDIAPTKLIIKTNSTQLEKLSVSGSIDFRLESPLNGKTFTVLASGASDVYLRPSVRVDQCKLSAAGASDMNIDNLECNFIEVKASGASDIDLKGKASKGEFSAAGSCDIDAYKFIVAELECSASGSSDLNIHATEYLKAQASGSSDISYKGNPKKEETRSSGSSDVKRSK